MALAAGLLILAVLAAYWNSFSTPFILDDSLLIVDNPSIRQLWPISTVLSPPSDVGSGGRPFLNLTLAANHAVHGTSVRGYHVVNLLIHILAGLTLFGVVRRTLMQARWQGRFSADAFLVAFVVALLWSLHPLQTESVTYLSQRAESLMGLCYLSTLYCFIRGAEPTAPRTWLALSGAACMLGMASKEVMVSAPLLVLIYDRIFLSGTFREAWRQRRLYYAGLASTWLVLAFLMVSSHVAERGIGYGQGVTSWSYLLTECRVVVQYLGLTLWPHPLVFDYGFDLAASSAWQIGVCGLLLGLLATATGFAFRRHSALAFLGCWFFAILLPTSSVVPVVRQPMAESRLYLPLVAVVALVVVGTYARAGRKALVAFAALALCLGWMTSQRNADYRSGLAIWTDTVAKQPMSARAHLNLGFEYLELGRLSEAIPRLEEALRLRPDYPEAHADLGSALGQAHRPAEAVAHLEAALRSNPNFVVARNNLGAALVDLGRATEAVPHFETVLHARPDYAAALFGLGNALLHLNRAAEAVPHFEAALRSMPGYLDAHIGLALAFSMSGRFAEAVGHYEAALRVNAGNAITHHNLASTLVQIGRTAEAIPHYREAVRLAPDYAEAHGNLAEALAQAGRNAEAIKECEEALRLNPGLTRPRALLARLQAPPAQP